MGPFETQPFYKAAHHNAMQASWKGKSAIIGFFWAAAADCNFVMVTSAGLELYTLAADRQACPSRHHHALDEGHPCAGTLNPWLAEACQVAAAESGCMRIPGVQRDSHWTENGHCAKLWLADKASCPIQAMHFKSQLQHPVKWWRYSHESRLVLLGTGELGLWLQVGQTSSWASHSNTRAHNDAPASQPAERRACHLQQKASADAQVHTGLPGAFMRTSELHSHIGAAEVQDSVSALESSLCGPLVGMKAHPLPASQGSQASGHSLSLCKHSLPRFAIVRC